MPTTLTTLIINDNELEGPIQLAFPLAMRFFNVKNNRLSGLSWFISLGLCLFDCLYYIGVFPQVVQVQHCNAYDEEIPDANCFVSFFLKIF
jgi:hypothetical protein